MCVCMCMCVCVYQKCLHNGEANLNLCGRGTCIITGRQSISEWVWSTLTTILYIFDHLHIFLLSFLERKETVTVMV